MFHLVDAMLKTLLEQMPRGKEFARDFVAPDRTYTPTALALNLFLCDVRENRELRDGTATVRRTGNGYSRELPPLHVDCEYLVTTWTKGGETGIREEHELLGQALLYLSRFPVIPAEFYKGTELMAQLYKPDSEEHCAPVTMVAQARPDGDLGQFWTALGIAPRPSFRLTVTLAVELGQELEQGRLVTAVDLTIGQRTSPTERGLVGAEQAVTIGGRVLRQDGTGIKDAWVQLKQTAQGTDFVRLAESDQQGHYIVKGIPSGTYTIRVRAPGFQEQERQVDVPSLQEKEYPPYDLIIEPLA